jgi:hypothetical protein
MELAAWADVKDCAILTTKLAKPTTLKPETVEQFHLAAHIIQ